MKVWKLLICSVFIAIAVFVSGCDQMKNIPSDKLGMKLTPTGWEQKVYSPGQVDVGQLQSDGTGNTLYLVQSNGFQVKESFSGRESNAGKEDHRCVTGKDKSPFSLDVRLLLALPDYKTPAGIRNLSTILSLGKPESTSDSRILQINAQSVYEQQAQQVVRNKIRIVCASYDNFEDVWKSYLSEDFQKKVQNVVARALVEANVPLQLVSAFPSNLKQDETVMAATTAQQSANQRMETVKTISEFLDKDPSGTRRMVYYLQTMQEIVNTAGANGHNTIILAPGTSGSMIPINGK